MGKNKQFIKAITPVFQVIKIAKNKSEAWKKRRLNKRYQKSIDRLIREDLLDAQIDMIQQKLAANRNVIYYIITCENSSLGICGYISFFLPHLAYAIAKGYVPVIDMQSFSNIYQSNGENSWELFFEQPFCVSLAQMKGKKCLKSPSDFWYSGMPHIAPMMEDSEIQFWHKCYQRLVRFNRKSSEYVHQELERILTEPYATVGVIYRGTDYTQGEPIGHPIQPTQKMLANSIENVMNCGNYTKIYIASDEKRIVQYLQARFPGKVLINSRMFYDEVSNADYSNYNKNHVGISGVRFDREDDNYLRGIEYLSSIHLVASCGALVAGGCGGTITALYMNGTRFRDVSVFQLGRYGFDPVPTDT